MIISIDGAKAFDKIQHQFMMKTLGKPGIERDFPNLIKNLQKTKQTKKQEQKQTHTKNL